MKAALKALIERLAYELLHFAMGSAQLVADEWQTGDARYTLWLASYYVVGSVAKHNNIIILSYLTKSIVASPLSLIISLSTSVDIESSLRVGLKNYFRTRGNLQDSSSTVASPARISKTEILIPID